MEGGFIRNIGLDNVEITGNRYVGGLVGEFVFFVPSYGKYGEAAVWNCYTDVSVSGDRFIGGLTGGASTFRITPIESDEYDDVIPEFAGIYESFSVGQVAGQSSTGGFIGGGYAEYTQSNYWDRESSDQNQWIGRIPMILWTRPRCRSSGLIPRGVFLAR